MRNVRDVIVLALTIGLEVYLVVLAGRHFGWNETTIDAWAAASTLGLLVTNRYFAWWGR
jgi:hypothetical protein